MKIIIAISIISFLIVPETAIAQVEQEESFDTFTLYLGNDYFAGNDQGYTDGIKLI
jgi:hypothetical protein